MNTHVNPEMLRLTYQPVRNPQTTRKKLFIVLAGGVAVAGLGFRRLR